MSIQNLCKDGIRVPFAGVTASSASSAAALGAELDSAPISSLVHIFVCQDEGTTIEEGRHEDQRSCQESVQEEQDMSGFEQVHNHVLAFVRN